MMYRIHKIELSFVKLAHGILKTDKMYMLSYTIIKTTSFELNKTLFYLSNC